MDAPSTPTPDAILRRLEWTVIRRLDGVLQGDYRTLFRGAGLDLADLREYQHHDDVRHIDWNVTARLQQPYVREFTEDRELTAWFLLDLSGSVDFGSARSKRSVSAEFVAVLARLLTRHGNRVGAMLYGDALGEVLPPRGSRQHVLHLLQRMMKHQAKQASTTTQLEDLLRRAAPLMPRRSTVFVVSDFLSTPGWDAALAQLSLRHDVLAVRLYDPLEMALPDLGMVTLQDAETGEQFMVDTNDPGFRSRYEKGAEQQEDALRESLARAGVDTLELSTDEDLLATLLRFVDLRKQRMRLNSGAGMPAHLKGNTTGGRHELRVA
ncbi:DUF58 domain-containing protein [Rhizobacter sp. J219]|jgi:uncharacterized protein (DUF58 family)|uniref:DUF58 domain-containing protein n=1 Tax=Rhizobacter sp. J219 TaxID=2898430 RepID=UPI00215187B9|nr:DUF58 domain-containing protein [Rhizobacter sp. J219]MCR5883185.1 DUF58 domain-containing protein [Rhizobacter sp. J219]